MAIESALRIDGTNRSQGVGKSGTASRSGGLPDFVPAGGAAPSRVSTAAPAMSMTGIDAILALQAVGGPLEGRKRAVRRGRTLLDQLDAIKADLLLGRVNAEQLDDMMATLAELRQQGDPGLDSVLDDIDLRVRVELAKFGRFPGL